ncbi:MAG: YifB family Mg chelatase-like AAA ATPase [Treponema sp.]|nr:YifB family Mg chelatase-like AAA ATPase [Treponema sp.]
MEKNNTEDQNELKAKYEEEKIPYVILYYSESSKFPSENKIYTLKEFNELLTQADSEFHNRKKYAEKKYGSADKYWELEDEDKLPEEDKGIQFGYDKTSFKLCNIPNPKNPGDTFSYEPTRYDIGDGNGSVFDFVRATCSHDDFIEALNALETQLYFPGVTEFQRKYVEKVISEETSILKSALKENMKGLDKAQAEYKELHKKWLIESTDADRVDEQLKSSLQDIKSTYDSSMNNVFAKVLEEYPFAADDPAGNEFLSFTANEVKKMIVSELYLPGREAQKAMNADNYKVYNSVDWSKLRRIWEMFPANVNMTKYIEEKLALKYAEEKIPKVKKYPELEASEKSSGELTQEDLEICKKVIPPVQLEFTMDLIKGEDGQFFRNKLKEIADTYRRINVDEELINDDGTHTLGFRYFLGNTEIFLSEIDSYGIGFGYNILNGDFQMSEWGSTSLDEILSIPYMEMDYHVPENITIEAMLYKEHPEEFPEYGPAEIIQTELDLEIPQPEEPVKPLEIYSFSPFGYEGTIVHVETDLRKGIPAYDIVGLADSAVKETRERIHCAFVNSGLNLPSERILQSLSPADLRKDTPMDLSMAVGILSHTKQYPVDEPILVLGELDLSGNIRPVRGAAAAVNTAKAAGIRHIVCDPATAELLKSIDDIKILECSNLKEVDEKLMVAENFRKTEPKLYKAETIQFNEDWLEDYKDILERLPMEGHFETIRAIEVAVAGKHNLLAAGAPGCGKTLLIQSLVPALTPNLTEEEAVQPRRIASLAGLDSPGRDSFIPPFRMPHQTATVEGICGGGPNCRPGEVSLAHKGVLFMDEAAEFRSSVVQMLRVPLESRHITLSRAGRSTTYPADFQLIMAMNPCPCGCYGSPDKICLDSERAINQYWKKISNPLLDRIEIKAFVEKDETDTRKLSIEEMKAHIAQAFEIQRKREVYNSHLTPEEIQQYCKLDKDSLTYLNRIEEKLSPRGKDNLLKLSLTIANLDGREEIRLNDIKEARELSAPVFEKPRQFIYQPGEKQEVQQEANDVLETAVPFPDDVNISRSQITDAEVERKRIIEPILNGERTGMYKAFKDFEDKGVFDIQGTHIKLSKNGGLTETGWKQLQAAMEIYRSKKFETFRYILIDQKTGEIADQLAITSHMPNFCNVSKPNDETLKQVISRAEEKDYLIAVCHNHPSGNIMESSFDRDLTNSLDCSLRRNDGLNRFAGHIILDHDSFNLAVPSKTKPGHCQWKKIDPIKVLEVDRFSTIPKPEWAEAYVGGTTALKEIAQKINDTESWNDDFIPVVFTNSDRNISGVQYYSKNFFENKSEIIRTEFQSAAMEAGAISAFPVITDFLWKKLGNEAETFEKVMKSHVSNNVFTDVAINHTTITEKYDIEAGKSYYSFFHDQSDKKVEVFSTWEPEVNPRLFPSEPAESKEKRDMGIGR